MKRFTNYLKNGKGRGLWITAVFTLILAVLMGSLVNISMRNRLNQPDIQGFLNSIPEVKVENSVVVSPLDMEKTITFGNKPFLTLQTSKDEFLPTTPSLAYLTRKNLVILNVYDIATGGQPQYTTYPLPQNAVINADYINKFFTKKIVLLASFMGGFVLAVLWALFGVQVLFAWIFAKLARLKLNRGAITRVCITTLILYWLLTFISFFTGFGLPVLTTMFQGALLPLFCTSNMVYAFVLTMIVLFFIRNKKETKKKA